MQPIESLERRQLLAGVTITFSTAKAGGILRIAGTSGDDAVQVALKGKTQFTVSDGTQTQTFNRAAVARLSFIGGDGNDSISIGRVPLRAYLDGGNGRDSLSASNGDADDALFGGAGNDYLYAGPGNDQLDGGTGTDLMFGGDGRDNIMALSDNTGDDTISGGNGADGVSFAGYASGVIIRVGPSAPPQNDVNDVVLGDVESILGSPQGDQITNESGHAMYIDGGAGNDTLVGGSAAETLYGGAGRDSLVGGGGNDLFKAANANVADGIDTIVGGSGGADWAYYDNQDVVSTLEGRITFREGPELEQIYTDPNGEFIGL